MNGAPPREEAYRAWRWMVNGTPTQLTAYRVLSDLSLMEKLSHFDPVHVGTIAMGVDIEGSDIDIVCCAPSFDDLEKVCCENFASYESFSLRRITVRGQPACVISFTTDLPIEIYAEHRPVELQNGFRHYVIARRLLTLGGIELIARVRQLKEAGLKTEPAFATLLGLEGDPYVALLELEREVDTDLVNRLQRTLYTV